MRAALPRAARSLLAAGTLLSAVTLAAPAQAAANPYERGPAPTEQSVTAEKGPFAVETIEVPAGSGTGFNLGTIYAPTDRSQGTFGAVAIAPGFVTPKALIDWYGPRLASQGFVVMTLETIGLTNLPDERAAQLLAALDYMVASSRAKDRIDASRLAVMGYSMGGGGTLRAAQERPALKTAIPLAPWHVERGWQRVTVPTLIFGADNDFIAGVATHAEPFYQNLTAAREKAYLELKGAGHSSFVAPNTTVAKYSIAWLKRFVDDDTRYDRFLCPAPRPDAAIAEYRDTCPN
ncbi:alpha/beta hydrolase family protein [Actinomadura flavalba]|uniref:alpha/beta hydrolase family protein n=1 Tax=Actinomadura flavalba TaxID=1120938 RepID=UPI0003815303|nr:dienelactone hydrolase family protein [Actinomadura flavalba]